MPDRVCAGMVNMRRLPMGKIKIVARPKGFLNFRTAVRNFYSRFRVERSNNNQAICAIHCALARAGEPPARVPHGKTVRRTILPPPPALLGGIGISPCAQGDQRFHLWIPPPLKRRAKFYMRVVGFLFRLLFRPTGNFSFAKQSKDTSGSRKSNKNQTICANLLRGSPRARRRVLTRFRCGRHRRHRHRAF